MENKNVGFLICGIAVVIGIIILLFNDVIYQNIGLTCSHGPTCEMYSSLKVQTYISLSIALIILIIGLFLIFAKEPEKLVIKTIKEKKKKLDLNGLDKDEKKVISLIQEENGAIFQATLMEKMEIGKVKATRLLDKLEAKQLIERKRRGMNNVVVLKS